MSLPHAKVYHGKFCGALVQIQTSCFGKYWKFTVCLCQMHVRVVCVWAKMKSQWIWLNFFLLFPKTWKFPQIYPSHKFVLCLFQRFAKQFRVWNLFCHLLTWSNVRLRVSLSTSNARFLSNAASIVRVRSSKRRWRMECDSTPIINASRIKTSRRFLFVSLLLENCNLSKLLQIIFQGYPGCCLVVASKCWAKTSLGVLISTSATKPVVSSYVWHSSVCS